MAVDQPLVNPVLPCQLADMVCAMSVADVADPMDVAEPEDARAVPDTVARPTASSPAITRPAFRVPLR